MHLLVLSAFRRKIDRKVKDREDGSQCTFWCSVLSDARSLRAQGMYAMRLNAPFGAQCFPTGGSDGTPDPVGSVSMHLLVLSAFRPANRKHRRDGRQQVSMHLLVLSAFRPLPADGYPGVSVQSQCTFWCSVLSDRSNMSLSAAGPHGSQCTFWCSVLSDIHLNRARVLFSRVSMHLLVLSAFRPVMLADAVSPPQSQCTFWCSVLSDAAGPEFRKHGIVSQCTFWCSVLSDIGR